MTTSPHALDAIRQAVMAGCPKLEAPYPPAVLFFSTSDGQSRARIVSATGSSVEGAWEAGLAVLQRHGRLAAQWLRVDWVLSVEPTTWGAFRERLRDVKRNYVRCGLSLDVAFETAFQEQELNANAVLYGGSAIEHAVVNDRNLAIYAGQRFGINSPIDTDDATPLLTFKTGGVFSDGTDIHPLCGEGPQSGRRSLPSLDVADVAGLIERGSSHLARQVDDGGAFVYGYHPCFDRQIDAYNTLRHASTTYAMIEAWEVTRDPVLGASIDRALAHLTTRLIRRVALPDGTEAAFLIDVEDEIKLGGNAVAILALTKHAFVFGSHEHEPLMDLLACGIAWMQDRETGAFVHVLHASSLSVKVRFRTIYYEGEAAFALMRLHALTGNPRWLDLVEKAFEHFIQQEHWRHHDHWLSYCVNELTRYRPKEAYFRFGLQNVADHLGFVSTRITAFPTLLELMMAAREMISRLMDRPDLSHLLDMIDLGAFVSALEARAHALLNSHFWPELAMYFRRPDRIVGSFFIRHHAFRVRIDDVEHFLSGFIAYKTYLGIRQNFEMAIRRRASIVEPAGEGVSLWQSRDVVEATGGAWLSAPPAGWGATGLCIHAATLQPHHMVVARMPGGEKGIPPGHLTGLKCAPSAILTDDPVRLGRIEGPVLHVPNADDAIIALGAYARKRMAGQVVAVTGSAGKTSTVSMLSRTLSVFGPTSHNTHNANLCHGLAWNLASMPRDRDYVVLEMAVGRMAKSARLVRPDIAVVTNIYPAHLTNGKTIADIARTKSAIVSGMAPGSVLVLNRDMAERERFAQAAQVRRLRIVYYGTAPDSDVRLMEYDAATGKVEARVHGQRVLYRLRSSGLHMAMNSLAVLATVAALGQPIPEALSALAGFEDLPGRGAQFDVDLDGRRVSIIDDAYNANPGSMTAALERLAQTPSRGRRIAVLGEMAELGGDAEMYHRTVIDTVFRNRVDRLYVLGTLYDESWAVVPPEVQAFKAPSLRALHHRLIADLADGDLLLVKGSNSTGLRQIVAALGGSHDI
ncbi:UDP-N-acetylmuramoyl-tripeptide--D-alanyl-D-alanine ligase [Rhizobium sp. PP-CC-3A-592]|nr:UDP-N-acetylmuramoyl-tripeptide--D-alanyl-D-alanine ligase [Rhizobium sp. PP-CC-3A-592]